mmetsp:Transcript_41989/g.82325  ORF Transcript_41989/g.82325 Transcript_41989/m.82325 type:complete len:292 (+) Transcript_41989:406-1281(+)
MTMPESAPKCHGRSVSIALHALADSSYRPRWNSRVASRLSGSTQLYASTRPPAAPADTPAGPLIPWLRARSLIRSSTSAQRFAGSFSGRGRAPDFARRKSDAAIRYASASHVRSSAAADSPRSRNQNSQRAATAGPSSKGSPEREVGGGARSRRRPISRSRRRRAGDGTAGAAAGGADGEEASSLAVPNMMFSSAALAPSTSKSSGTEGGPSPSPPSPSDARRGLSVPRCGLGGANLVCRPPVRIGFPAGPRGVTKDEAPVGPVEIIAAGARIKSATRPKEDNGMVKYCPR